MEHADGSVNVIVPNGHVKGGVKVSTKSVRLSWRLRHYGWGVNNSSIARRNAGRIFFVVLPLSKLSGGRSHTGSEVGYERVLFNNGIELWDNPCYGGGGESLSLMTVNSKKRGGNFFHLLGVQFFA